MLGLLRRRRHDRAGHTLYAAAVSAAREPFFYESLGVPDTLDGRFDMVGLHAFLLIRRLQAEPPPGPGLAQAVFDAMFSDMDRTLREMGVGDLGVGKRVRAMWEGFHGRSVAYQQALDQGDWAAMSRALARNVWREDSSPDPSISSSAMRLATVVMAQDRHLVGQSLPALERGIVDFRTAAELVA